MTAPEFRAHDHAACIADGLETAQALCRERGAQLTPARRRVLEILLLEHRAMGAYEVLDILREEGLGSQPPVAYRALDFLARHGLVHRIEALNAYIACGQPGAEHRPAFLICTACGTVAEALPKAAAAELDSAARDAGFTVTRRVIELQGLCPNCRAGSGAEAEA